MLQTCGFLAVAGVLQRSGAVLNVAQHAADVRVVGWLMPDVSDLE